MSKRQVKTKYRVTEDGSIFCNQGGLLYDSESLEGLSKEARKRLAQLHTQHPDLSWEGVEGRKGAWDILIDEGLA